MSAKSKAAAAEAKKPLTLNSENVPLSYRIKKDLQRNGLIYAMTAGADYLIGETIQYATVVVATLPILCIYPFVQKYFVKGVMIGAIKG